MHPSPKRPLPCRLDKFLADAGVGSRSVIEALHAAGRIEVAGERDRPLWRLVDPMLDTILVDGVARRRRAPTLFGLLHKPAGVLTAMRDAQGHPTVAELLSGEWNRRAMPVGRLDKATTGALLVTDDGDLSFLLTHPAHHVWKTYRVTVHGPVAEDDPRLAMLRDGIDLDGRTTRPARVRRLPGPEIHHRYWTTCDVEVSIREGRKRQVRRMMRAAKLRLVHLHRTHVGPLSLGELAEGALRPLTAAEVEALYDAAGGRAAARASTEQRLRARLETGRLVEEDAAIVRRYLARVRSP